MRALRRRSKDERGAASVLVAGSLVFLLGAAALAVDVSGFYENARSNQTSADLACLAGVKELPNTSAAIELAAHYARINVPSMSTASLTSTGATTARLSNGTGDSVEIDAQYGGDPVTMRIVVTERSEVQLGGVMGADAVEVTQSAVCKSEPSLTPSPAALPFGALGGPFSGDLFDCAAKVTGNCGALGLGGNGADDFRRAVGGGVADELEKHHGAAASPDGETGNPVVGCPATGACNQSQTETGNMVGPFNQGIRDRLSDVSGANCDQGGSFNCDSLANVLGGTPGTLTQAFGPAVGNVPNSFPTPSFMVHGWESSLYGEYDAVRDQQYYYDGSGIKCDSPRLATVPIVAPDDDWAPGDPVAGWPNGKKAMKIIGFYTVYIREPSNATDAGNGNGNGLDQIVGDVVWFGPNAQCADGSKFTALGSHPSPGGGDVKLIAG